MFFQLFGLLFIFIVMNKKEKNKIWYQENKIRLKAKQKEYYAVNKEKIKQSNKTPKNKEKIRAYYNNRYNSNPLHKLKTNIKNLIGNSIRRGNFKKLSRTEQILGCTYDDLKIYLESKFEPWMNWDNRGEPIDGIVEQNKTWDIDHIIPLSSATCEADIIRLNHYTNLQPLCMYYNRYIKKDNI